MTAQSSPIAARTPRLAGFLGIASGELGSLTSLAGLYLATSVAFVLAETSAFGLFVEAFGAHSLPYAYLSIAVLSSIVGFSYLRVSQRVSFSSSLQLNLAFLATLCLTFWLGLRSSIAPWFIFLLPFAFQTVANLGSIVVWHLASHRFNVRQAKRLFGIIVAGGWLGTMLGGALIAPALMIVSPPDLYLLAAVALLIGILMLRWRRIHPEQQASAAAALARAPDPNPAGIGRALANPYARLIFIYTALWWLSFFIVENIFFHQVEHALESSDALTGFLGWQRVIVGAIAMSTALFVTSRVARRYGLRTGLLIMPVVVTLAVLPLALSGMLEIPGHWLFWSATVARSLNVALGFSLSQTMGTLLFQPLVGASRGTTQTIAEGMVQPLAIGVAGIILLVGNDVLHLDALGLSWIFLPIAGLWFWSIIRVSRLYPVVMSEALRKRVLGESVNIQFDRAAISQLRKGLGNPRASVASYSLHRLEQVAPEEWSRILVEELPSLLLHPATEVRRQVLASVMLHQPAGMLPVIRSRVQVEPDPPTRGMLIRILARMRDPDSAHFVEQALKAPEAPMRRGAILGILESGAGGAETALAGLRALADSSHVADRITACQIARETEHTAVVPLLSTLMQDADVAVRHAALRAAGQHLHAALSEQLIDACDHPLTARVAEGVLIAHGEQHLELIAKRLAGTSGHPRDRHAIGLVRVLGRIPSARSVEVLRPLLSAADPDLRLQVLDSLSRLAYRAPVREEILGRVRQEVITAAWIAAALADMPRMFKLADAESLRRALEAEFLAARHRALLLLSFICDSAAILRAQEALAGAPGHPSPMALEIVDSQLPSHAKPWILPLLDHASPAERVHAWGEASLEAASGGPDEVLRTLLGPDRARTFSPWARMCAIHTAVRSDSSVLEDCLHELASDAHPGVAAMAGWAAAVLAKRPDLHGDPTMLSTVEKVLVLKSAPLFGGTLDNVLAEVANLVEELHFDAQHVIFEKGQPGDSLYIVVSGRVKVLDEDRLLNELGEGEAFGELALLDPEPRLATVVAAEPTSLLRLDAPHFREILDSQPEVSEAVIRVITKYLRSQLRFAREASARLQALESPDFSSRPGGP